MAALPPFSLLPVRRSVAARQHPLRLRAAAAWLARWADSLGAAGAFLCALHCALLPLALVLLPAAGLGVLASEGFEAGFTVAATLLAVASLWQGFRRHRGYHAWALVLPGLALVWAGLLIEPLHASVLPHALVMTVGGALIASAHLVNLKLSFGEGSACCAH